MQYPDYPMIDPVATGQNIIRLRKQKGLTVKNLQVWFGFNDPKAIYKWQTGQSLPSIDNLYALSVLLNVPMDCILVGTARNTSVEPQADASGSILSHFNREYQASDTNSPAWFSMDARQCLNSPRAI